MTSVLRVLLTLLVTTGSASALQADPVSPNLRDVPSRNALFTYINQPDNHYKFERLGFQGFLPGVTTYLLNMTSQQWLSDKEVVNPIWWHYLIVAVPHTIKNNQHGFLYIAGSDNDDLLYYPTRSDRKYEAIVEIARKSGSVAALLLNVPNQPTVFQNDPHKEGKVEDEIIAWTWDHFLEHPDEPEWFLLFPMVKAAVRAMDTVTSYTFLLNSKWSVSKYVLAGESKRGWTTWLTGAVDSRVVGVVPVVYDLLNMFESLHHMYQSLGGWTFAFEDYYALNLTQHLDEPNVKKLAALIDPFSYKDLLTMPKYIVGATGDEFFLLDNTYYFYKSLTGETMMRSFANARHNLGPHKDTFLDGIQGFYMSIVENTPRPKMTWELKFSPTGGEIVMQCSEKPLSVVVESASTESSTRRDFRRLIASDTHPYYKSQSVSWTVSEVTTASDPEYSARFTNPSSGWMAFHIYATFQGPNGTKFELTTENMVIPNTLPFNACSGASCWGTIV